MMWLILSCCGLSESTDVLCPVLVQVERGASEKAVAAALVEEREKHSVIVADIKVSEWGQLSHEFLNTCTVTGFQREKM